MAAKRKELKKAPNRHKKKVSSISSRQAKRRKR